MLFFLEKWINMQLKPMTYPLKYVHMYGLLYNNNTMLGSWVADQEVWRTISTGNVHY